MHYKQTIFNSLIVSVLCALALCAPALAFADEVAASDGRYLADGVYEIASAANSSEVLDVVAGSTDNGANVTLWTSYHADRQRWKLTYEGNGFYTMQAVHSGQALDVVASGTESGTNVTQWPLTEANNQQWGLLDKGDGTFAIYSRCNGLWLAADGTGDGSNVCVRLGDGALTQQWVFTYVSSEPGTASLVEGVYEISSAVNGSEVLDVVAGSLNNGANVTLWTGYHDARQRWKVAYLDNGYYTISAVHSGQSLDVVASGVKSGTNVTQWPTTNADNQQWVIRDEGDGTFSLISRCNGLYLSANGSSDGSNVCVRTFASDSSQRWIFTNCQTVSNGVYTLSPYAGFDAGIYVGSNAEGSNLELQESANKQYQRFWVTYLDNGYYSIEAFHSGQSLDVVASGTASGTNVTQWSYYGNANQQWAILRQDDGRYKIISRCNDLYLSVAGSVAIGGANINMETIGSSSLQSWSFVEAPPVADGVYAVCSAQDSRYRLDVVAGSGAEGANVTLWENDGCPWQRFEISHVEGLYYKIIAVHSGQALDVVASGKTSPTNVTQWSYFGNDNQLWKIEVNSDGTYSFKSKCNNLYLDIEDGVAADGANICVKTGSGSGSQHFVLEETTANVTTVKHYSYSLETMLEWQRASVYATYSDEAGLAALDPDTYDEDDDEYYRFADLRGYSGLTAEQLNARIASTSSGRKGTLASSGEAVVAASKRYKVNEAAILSIALLESGWGTSKLASGTYYDGKGFWDGDTWVKLEGYTPGTYYNFFGIGAYDSDPFKGGITTAVKNGWSSVSAAIEGGAEWIAENYIYRSSYPQTTLYEMRWDPDRSEVTRERGWHQYSSSITWDTSIAAGQLAECYKLAGLVHPNLGYIIPSYLDD